MDAAVDHSENSTLRELIVEHLFVGDVLRRCWTKGLTDVEVLRSESDSSGYDIVIELDGIVRHIKLKTTTCSGIACDREAVCQRASLK